MADFLHLDVGQTMLAGLVAAIIPITGMWLLAQYIGRTVNAPGFPIARADRGNCIRSRPPRMHGNHFVLGLGALLQDGLEDATLPGYARVYVDDPFGNRLELMEPLVTENGGQ